MMTCMESTPRMIIVAGPNGAGKSTTAPFLLRDAFAVEEFVNADTIARGLSAFAPERSALQAGKIMLRRIRDLAARRRSFAFETTLASRLFAPWAASLADEGYKVHLIFLSLPSADVVVQRVDTRVRLGGHAVEEDVIRRRYASGWRNLFALYMPVVDSWILFDGQMPGVPKLIAEGALGQVKVHQRQRYDSRLREYAHG